MKLIKRILASSFCFLFLNCQFINLKNDKQNVKILLEKITENQKISCYTQFDTLYNSKGELIYLKIYTECLIDSLPNEFYQLVNLQKFDFERIGLIKIKSLKSFSRLIEINLSNNRLKDTFDFAKILPPSLERISLMRNEIKIFLNSNSLTNIKKVNICNNLNKKDVIFKNLEKDSCIGCYKNYMPNFLQQKRVLCN